MLALLRSRPEGGKRRHGVAAQVLNHRTATLLPGGIPRGGFAFWIGLGFILLGLLFDALAIVQYRRSIATLRPVEIPPGYWVNLSVYASALLGLLGIALALYLIAS